MKKKPASGNAGNKIVFSTDPSYAFDEEPGGQNQTIPPAKQKLRVVLDTRHRAGKAVTVVVGFIGKQDDLEALGKKLKTYCGSGGTVKDRDIIVQGDQREKVVGFLKREGYGVV